MSTIPINLAVEDELSEVVLHRILGECANFSIGSSYRRGGFGYLRSTIRGWNNAAKSIPFLVLTDLDQYTCPAKLISEWLPVPQHPNLIFRVAVREVESWILADSYNFSRYVGIHQNTIPIQPDLLLDAKATLVQLSSSSRFRTIRNSIVPRHGSTAKQGPEYNSCLGEFVRKNWDVNNASTNSPSLARAINRISTFRPTWFEDFI